MTRVLTSLSVLAMCCAIPEAHADDIYARAATTNEIVTERLEDGTFRAHVPFAAVREQQGGMRLQGANAGEELSVALAPQADTQDARILLRHVTSRAQAETQPHLRLDINGQFAAQVDAATNLTAALDEIRLDGRTFKTGFNKLRLDALQRYTFDCQDPTAAELWTEVDTERSSIEFNYKRRPFTGTLADLDAFMSPGIGGVEHLVIAVGGDKPTRDHLKWGALASQAVANRLQYRLPEISRTAVHKAAARTSTLGPAPFLALDKQAFGESDVILIGTFDEIGGVLSVDASTIGENESYISIGASPADPSHFLIALAGHNAAAVERAVLALALESFPFSATNDAVIRPEDAPQGVVLSTRGPLTPGVTYSLADLGFRTTTTIGQTRGVHNILLELPADFFAREEDEVIFSLDFAYGAALEPDSVLNILVNGIFRSAIALSNPAGEAAAGYEIRLPARVFSPGKNLLRFDAELSKQQSGECSARNDRNLAFVLEDSTLIRIPDSPSYAELPNLALMAEAGYPYSGATTQDFAMRSASRSDDAMAATWTLAARLGQIHGAVFRDVAFDFGVDAADRNTLLVGGRADLEGLLGRASSLSPTIKDDPRKMLRRLSLSDAGRNGLIISGENPEMPNTLLTVVTAPNDAMLIESVRTLVKGSHWSQLKGEAAVWRENPSTVATQTALANFHTGNITGADRVSYENGRAPLRWVLLMGALLFSIAIALALVGRFMRQRSQGK